jgi:chromate transporter
MMRKIEDLNRSQLLWVLFRSTFALSAFTFGGGYVIVPLMRRMFVDNYKWIEEKEMLDLVAIGQSAPGAIAVNTSILIGYKLAGVLGAFVTLLGTVLPPLILLTLMSYIYEAIKDNVLVETLFYGMSIGVAVVILDAVVTMGAAIVGKRQLLPIVIMVLAFIATYFFDIGVVVIILLCATIGIATTFLGDAAKKKKQNKTSDTTERRN